MGIINDEQWMKMYNLAKKYYEDNGNLKINKNYEINNLKLGIWIQTQRNTYKNNKLSKDKIELLELLDMVWDVLDVQWQEMYLLAKEYYKNNSHLRITWNYETKDGIKLGRWVINQRKNYKKGILSLEQIKALESIGMIWDIKEVQWKKMYLLAKKYYKNNGHLLVPKLYETIDGFKLGSWISHQRNYYKNNKLSNEQIDLLNEIEMIWDASDKIGTSFSEYFIYSILQRAYGKDKVFYRDKSLGFELDIYIPYLKIGFEFDGSRWHNDKKDIKKDIKALSKGITLYRFRENGLDSLKTSNCFCLQNSCFNILELTKEIYDILFKRFDINVEYLFQDIYNEYASNYLNTNPWDEKFKLVKRYYDENGHLLIPWNYETNNGIKLGGWIRKQREAYKKGTLSYSQVEKLNSIGMIWEIRQQKKRAI